MTSVAEPRPDPAEADARARVDAVYRADSRRVLATLIRVLGDFDLAEEALSDAFAEALKRWPSEGVPAHPRAWLVSAGRFRALDALRRRARHDASLAMVARRMDRIEREVGELAASSAPGLIALEGELVDDRLRLIFTCAHPALAQEARVALTVREVCGLATESIARAFLSSPTAIAQRIVRAKARIHELRIPYEVPGPRELPERLDAVLQVVYLVFNEGHHASSGDALVRTELCAEAIRLGRLLLDLLGDAPDRAGEPREPEAAGLLALMLLHDARRAGRSDDAGELVTLERQDRACWDRARIGEGAALVERALRTRRFGPYTLQAAIAAVHAEAPSPDATDWAQIAGLYDLLLRAAPSPVVALNRAVAVGMRDGAAAGLALVDALLARSDALADYVPAHATRADLCRRLGRRDEARAAYRQALELAEQAPERRYFERRLAELDGDS
jgi:RNA polymerase sigma-70 factor (ECF subfamily)